MPMSEMLRTLRALNTAEELLSYFRIPFDQRRLNVNRIAMLQRAHALLARDVEADLDDDVLYPRLRQLMLAAWEEIGNRDPATAAPLSPPTATPAGAFVPLDAVRGIGFTRREG
jgi:nitrogenase-stabilizing/protective protein